MKINLTDAQFLRDVGYGVRTPDPRRLTDLAERIEQTVTPAPAAPAAPVPSAGNKEKQQIFLEGVRYGRELTRSRGMIRAPRQEAERLYPTKVLRPRELVINGLAYRVVGGELQYRGSGSDQWHKSTIIAVEDLEKIKDLIANPTEVVELEEGAA